MVITPMLRPGAPVDMAKAENADKMPNADREDAIIVAVARDGSFFLTPGNKKIGFEVITEDVKDLMTGPTG